MRNLENHAVFLSYASEDAEAAQRICDALRAAGVEVWIDRSELTGGDAWDFKIREQIASCALFIPLISEHTQARKEGYFRLEWKLAETRSHNIAKGVPFIVPVTVDATDEGGALVPDAFVQIQWTKLVGGEASAAFVARVQQLLNGSVEATFIPVNRARKSIPLTRQGPKRLTGLAASATIGAAVITAYFTLRQVEHRRANALEALSATASSDKTRATVIPEKSIAVLPFTNMSENKDNAFFADGVQEDLLTDLANISQLKVISRTSVMQYRDTTKSIHQIAAELGVAFILEGSVRHSGGKIRVTGQLINASTDVHVWAKSYERDLIDVFAVQADLSHEIASALQAVLTPQENLRLDMRPTNSVAAYKFYQEGMAIVNRGVAHTSLEEALPLFQRAVAVDPNFAKVWAQIYWILQFGYYHENAARSRLAGMRDAVAHGIQADPNDFNVLFAAVNLAAFDGNKTLIGHYRQQIVELYPNRAEAYIVLADTAVDEQRLNDALSAYENARALDPLNKGVLQALEYFLLDYRRYDRAEEIENAIVQLDPEDSDAALRLASTSFFRTGSTDALKALLAKQDETLAMRDPAVRTIRFKILVNLEDADGMIKLWEKSSGNVTADAPNREVRMLIAAAYIEKGDRAHARPFLESSRDEALAQLAANPDALGAVLDLATALAMLGDQKEAVERVKQAAEIMKPMAPEANTYYEMAIARTWAGQKEEAIADLAQMLRDPKMGSAMLNVYDMRLFPLLFPLRANPNFEAILNDPANNKPLF